MEVPKSESVELKQFVYNGKKPAIKAICEYMEPQYREEYESFEQIYIPAYTIYKGLSRLVQDLPKLRIAFTV